MAQYAEEYGLFLEAAGLRSRPYDDADRDKRDNFSEWLQRTVSTFTARPDTQLVVRIHPGERYTKGPSVADVVRQALPELPEHILLVGADDPINTYDLVEIADLGLVYTTTVKKPTSWAYSTTSSIPCFPCRQSSGSPPCRYRHRPPCS